MSSGMFMLFGLVTALSLFAFNARQGDLLAAIGVSYQDGKDPFEKGGLLGGGYDGPVLLSSGFLYQNSLPLHFSSWTWSAVGDWRSGDTKSEGSYSLKVTSAAAGGTVGMSGPDINISGMQSITLFVNPDTLVGDLYINLYDKNGTALREQSLGWYTQSGMLVPGAWQQLTLPLKNFTADGKLPTSLSGFSVSTKNPGVAYVDAVQLSKSPSEHSVWIAPPDTSGQPFNPFATSTPVQLPYTFSPAPENLMRWFSYYGVFGPGKAGEIVAGPSEATKSTGSLTIFRGGRNWSNYRVHAAINWGEVSVFSLVARLTDDRNYVSCAVSRYGESVQIYQVQNGISNFISQTPGLPVRDSEPWKDVQVGMEVQGNRVSCFIHNEEVLSATLPTLAPVGTVGFETWDPNPAAAPHTLISFTVTPRGGE
jgi:hypothetical protein